MTYSTYYIDLSDKIPSQHTLTQKEINFINRLFLEMNIDSETEKDIRIETDSVEFGRFLIGVVRSYLRK